MKRNIILGLSLIILIGAITTFIVFRPAANTVKNEKPDFILTASELVMAFEAGEEQANQKYLGKVISVSGMIEEMTHQTEGTTIVLNANDAMGAISCQFADKQPHLPAGSVIIIKGQCAGYLMDVILSKCALED